MIDVHWVDEDGRTWRGDATLIDAWQQQSGFIWIDLCGEPADRERAAARPDGLSPAGHPGCATDSSPTQGRAFRSQQLPDLPWHQTGAAGSRDRNPVDRLFVGAGYLITRHDGDSVGVEQIKRDENLDALLRAPAQLLCRILKISANTYLDAILEVEEVLADLEEQMSAGGSDEVLMTVISYRTSCASCVACSPTTRRSSRRS